MTTNTTSPLKLCTMHHGPTGWIECEVTDFPLYNPRSLMPYMEITNKALNVLGKTYVPMTGIFYMKSNAPVNVSADLERVQS